MDELFNSAETKEEVSKPASNKKAVVNEMKKDITEKLTNDPSFAASLRRLSSSLKVIHTFGAGKGGNIILDKEASTEDNRVLTKTSQVVGYEVQNIGTEPIQYKTEVYTNDESGLAVGEVVEKTLQPGETIQLTRQYMTMLCSQTEISFKLSNGKMIMGSKKLDKNSTLKEQLEHYYFSFDNVDGEDIHINDDDVKLAIDDEDANGNRVVKPEYFATFGYLNNPKKASGEKKNHQKITTQDIMANYVQSLISKGQGATL